MNAGWWRWQRSHPTTEAVAAEVVNQKLKRVREVRKSALQNLLQKLDDIPVDKGIESIGLDINGKPRK